ncbi:MAG: NifU family protein [Chitinophagales bacterium]
MSKTDLFQRVEDSLNSIRPHLEADGGNVEVVGITEDHTVQIRWLGNCEGCRMSFMTMKAGVEQAIRTAVPIIKEVVAVN